MELDHGTYIAKRFQILNRISVDVEKPVYLAADRVNQTSLGSLDVLVALRILDNRRFNQEILEEEIGALRTIKNDHVLQVFELINTENLTIVSVEHTDYGTLAESMQSCVFSTKEIVEILLMLVDGLESLHSKGLYHWAISEDAIYINRDGIPKIDPLERYIKPELQATSDVEALGLLGLKLASAEHYLPKGKFLNFFNGLWSIDISHPADFIKFLNNIAEIENTNAEEMNNLSGMDNITYRDIKSVGDWLKQYAKYLKNNKVSANQNYVNLIFKSSSIVLFYIIIVLITLAVLFSTAEYFI